MQTFLDSLPVAREKLIDQQTACAGCLLIKSVSARRRTPQSDNCPIKSKPIQVMLPLIRRFVDARPIYGYRRIAAVVNRELTKQGRPAVNRKRVHRIMQ